MIADKAVVEESAGFIRVIIRRPQAYSFRGKYKAPIPGIALIDSEGKRVETFAFRGEEQAKRLAETLRKLKD